MKVSVVVPVYNAARHLRECVDSIIGQSYSNLEIVLVNDGSTDESLSICREYEGADSRVAVYSDVNYGVSRARNRGIDESTGDYIMFVDSDDILNIDMVRVLLAGVESDGADVSVCRLVEFSGRINGVYSSVSGGEAASFTGLEMATRLLYQDLVVSGPVCKMMRRSLLENIRFEEGVYYAEDLDVAYRLFLAAGRVADIDYVGYFYRRHVGSAMGARFGERRMTGLAVCERILVSSRDISSELYLAAQSRLFMEAVYILISIPFASRRYRKFRRECWGVVKAYRKPVLTDTANTLSISRLSAALAYFGEYTLTGAHKIRVHLKRTLS